MLYVTYTLKNADVYLVNGMETDWHGLLLGLGRYTEKYRYRIIFKILKNTKTTVFCTPADGIRDWAQMGTGH